MSEEIASKIKSDMSTSAKKLEETLNRMRIQKFPVISGHVRSFTFDNKNWSRHGVWKMDLVFFLDQNCEDKVHGSDGLKRAMVFLSISQVRFFIGFEILIIYLVNS